jgi:hypothetical protein
MPAPQAAAEIFAQQAELAADPGRLPAWRLLPRFVAMDARLAAARLARRLGLRRLRTLPLDVPARPDSLLARRALELATQASAPLVLNHALRSWAFGAILAARHGLRLDREVYFVAAVLHDLGLNDDLQAEAGSFEWVGARRARAFCLGAGVPRARADLVHDAIALHASVGLAHRREPEVAMVHYGAGVDVLGIRLDEIPAAATHALLEQYPRLGFTRGFGRMIADQAARKPASHIAGHVGLGFVRRIEAAPFAE